MYLVKVMTMMTIKSDVSLNGRLGEWAQSKPITKRLDL